MPSFRARPVLLSGFLATVSCVSWGAVQTNLTRLAVDVTSSVRGTSVRPDAGVSVGPSAAGAFFQLDGSPFGRARLDTVMVRSNLVLFSTDVDVVLNGSPYADEDLIAFVPSSGVYAIYFDGSAAGIPAAADLDAACFEYGTSNLLLSLDKTATLPGVGVVRHNDVVRRAAGTFSLFVDGATELGLPVAVDIDALHHDGTNLYYSLNIGATVGSVTGRDDQVFVFHTATLSTSLLADLGVDSRADLTSLDFGRDTDGDGLTDFEELSGADEAATVSAGAGTPLSPNGYVSNPLATDSDGDGYADADEAVAGTDPGSFGDYLRLLAVSAQSGGRVVQWASVAGRRYDVQAASQLSLFTNVIATNVTATGASTSVTNASAPNAQYFRIRVRP